MKDRVDAIDVIEQWSPAWRHRARRARIRAAAEAAAAALRREFPQIVQVRLSFGTEEGGDAYLWITIPDGDRELWQRVLAAAAEQTAPYLEEGIGILPQIRRANAA